jgi:nucleotide-binding universal stress UspA family protein
MVLATIEDLGAAGDVARPLRRILLATDLTGVSAPAELAAIQLARRSGATLIILSIVDPALLRLPGGHFLTRMDQVRATREAAANALTVRARAAGIPTHFLIWEGDPGESILEVAASENVEAVVLGSHGRGRIGRLLLGSVSARVVESGRWTVFIARSDRLLRHDRTPDGPVTEGESAPR